MGHRSIAFTSPALPTRHVGSRRPILVCAVEPCAGCGREDGVAAGCDGAGRVIGGLGAVVKWWPIKAYRPCDYLVSARKRYSRKGQSLEEIAFGRKASGDEKSLQQRLRGE